MVLRARSYTGDVVREDTELALQLRIENGSVAGAVRGGIALSLARDSHWTATGDSQVDIADEALLAQIDAAAGVTVSVRGIAVGRERLRSGGRLVFVR